MNIVKKVKKGIISLVFVMLLTASMSRVIGVGEVRADGPTLVSTWADLKTAISSGGEIRLDADVIATASDTEIIVDKIVILDLNGHIINRNLTHAVGDGRVFNIDNHASLTIRDSSVGQTGKITGAWNEDDNGGCIYVSSGSTLNLEGGSIEGNKNAAVISSAGGVYNAGIFNMTGGKITGNTAGYGAGVLVKNDATFNMTGGEISGNTGSGGSVDKGAGVYAYNGASITLGGEAKITGNTNSTGAVSNLYIGEHYGSYAIILSSTALTGGAQIGVSTEATDTVAITTTGKDKAAFFTADDSTNFEIGTTSSDNCIYLVQRGSSAITGGGSGSSGSGSSSSGSGVSDVTSTIQLDEVPKTGNSDKAAAFLTLGLISGMGAVILWKSSYKKK